MNFHLFILPYLRVAAFSFMQCTTFNKNELEFFILSSSSIGVARQQSAYLAGSCHLCETRTLLRNRDWFISVSFMISVIFLSCSYDCPAAEQAACPDLFCITSRGSSFSFSNWISLHFHSSLLMLGLGLCL